MEASIKLMHTNRRQQLGFEELHCSDNPEQGRQGIVKHFNEHRTAQQINHESSWTGRHKITCLESYAHWPNGPALTCGARSTLSGSAPR